jgi:hypothetical protein
MPQCLRSLTVAASCGLLNLVAATPLAAASECAALERPGTEDHWYYLIYRKDSTGKAQIEIPVTSHPWFTKALLACAAQGFIPEGWAPDVAELLQNFPRDWVPPGLPGGASLGEVLAQGGHW